MHPHKKVKYAIIVLVCLTITIPLSQWYRTNRVEIANTLDGFAAYLDKRIPALMHRYSIPGVSIALIQRGKIAWSDVYGYADLATGRPMDSDTVLMAQSISKSVTAWGVLKLVQEGKMQLTDPVSKHIKSWDFPPSEFAAETVTIGQLLSLSAGLPLGDFASHYTPQDKTPSLQETLSGASARLMHAPGLAFSYSNTSYALLELLIEEVTHRDFAEYMDQEVLTPLGMRNSSFTWSQEYSKKIATGYDLKGKSVPPYIYPYKASGGLFAPIGDLARFVTAGMVSPAKPTASDVLTSDTINLIYTPQVKTSGIYGFVSDAYGLGHFVERLPSGHQAVWHGGQGNGWMTHFHLVPETGDGIVILTNSQRSWPFFSTVLTDWANWAGFSAVGMSTINQAETGLQIIINLLFAISVLQAWRLGSGVMSKKRRFAPFAHQTRLLRSGQLGLSAAVVSVLLWSVSQDYIFIVPLFPVLYKQLGISLSGVAVILAFSACLPKCSQGDCRQHNQSTD